MKSQDSITTLNVSILFPPVDTIGIDSLNYLSHNSSLISTLVQRESTAEQSAATNRAAQAQARNIFIVLISVLITITYTNKIRRTVGEIIILLSLILIIEGKPPAMLGD